MNTFLNIQNCEPFARSHYAAKTKSLPLMRRIMQRGLNEQYAAASGVVEVDYKYLACPEMKRRLRREYKNNCRSFHWIQFGIVYSNH